MTDSDPLDRIATAMERIATAFESIRDDLTKSTIESSVMGSELMSFVQKMIPGLGDD